MAKPGWWDLSAIGMSGLCLVHCLASGIFITGLSTISLAVPASHEFHIFTLAVAAPLAIWTLARGWRIHRLRLPPLLGIIGLGFMAVGVLPMLLGWPEVVLTVIGVSILAVAHALNWRGLHRRLSAC